MLITQMSPYSLARRSVNCLTFIRNSPYVRLLVRVRGCTSGSRYCWLSQCRLDQSCNDRTIGARSHTGTNRLDHLTHGLCPHCALGGSGSNFFLNDVGQFSLTHSSREVALQHGKFGPLAGFGFGSSRFLIYVCGFGALLGLRLQHPQHLRVGQGDRGIACHRGVFDGRDGHAQGGFLHIVARFHRSGEISLQLFEQGSHASIVPCPIGTLNSVANEAFELFFALLSLLALGGSIALLAARFLGGNAGRSLVSGVAPLRLAVPALVTSVSMLGSLYFSEAVNYRPCVLCWYQRIAMYSLAIVLVLAAVRKDHSIRPYAMVLAGIGSVISAYHWLLERWPSIDTGTCSADAPCSVPYFEVFGFVSLAFMAFCAFVTVLVFLSVSSGPSAATLESARTPESR